MAMYSRILLAVDLTADSVSVGERAQALAGALAAELHVIHVVEPLLTVAPMAPEPVAPVIVTTETELFDTAQAQIRGLGRKLGVPETRCHVVAGSTKSEIVRIASEQDMDLIVIGARERHGLALLFRQTEDSVLHHAPCDVLAVRIGDDSKSRKR